MEIGAQLTQATNMLIRAMGEATDEYVKAAEGMNEIYSNSARGKMNRRRIDREEELKATAKVNKEYDKMYRAIRKVAAQQKEGIEISQGALKTIEESADNLSDDLGVTSDTARLLADRMKQGIDVSDVELRNISDTVQMRMAERSAMQQQAAERVAAQDNLQRSMYKLKDSVVSATSAFFSWKSAVLNIGAGFARSFDEIETAMKHQSDMYALMSFNMDTWSGKLGLAPLEMQKMVAEYRPLIHSAQLASGSLTSLNDSVEGQVKAMRRQYDGRQTLMDQAYRLTGNYKDASKVIMQSQQMLQSMGTAFSAKELGQQTSTLIKQMSGFAKVTGESTEQQMEMLQQHLNSSEVQTELLKLSKQRRMGRIQEIMNSVQYQAAQRGSVKAALAAEKALSGLGNMSTKDRYKEAAKMQAVAGGMGVQMDPRMMAIIRKPEELRSAEERKILSEGLAKVSHALTAAQAAGGGRAMAAETMFGQLSGEMQQLIMSQNKQRQEGLGLGQEEFDALANQEEHMSDTAKLLADIKQLYDKSLGTLLKDPTAQILAGGFAAVGALLTSINLLLLAQSGRGLMSRAGGLVRGAGGAARGAGGAALGAGRAALGGAASGFAALGGGGMAGAGVAAGGLALAGGAGFAIGTAIDTGLEKWAPEVRNNMIDYWGPKMESVVHAFDSGFAEEKKKKEAAYKTSEEWERKRVEQQEKTNALRDELAKQQVELAKAMVAAQATGNEEAVKQQETTIKATEAQINASHKQTVEIARAGVRAQRG